VVNWTDVHKSYDKPRMEGKGSIPNMGRIFIFTTTVPGWLHGPPSLLFSGYLNKMAGLRSWSRRHEALSHSPCMH
jgi:hypothetical protein